MSFEQQLKKGCIEDIENLREKYKENKERYNTLTKFRNHISHFEELG